MHGRVAVWSHAPCIVTASRPCFAPQIFSALVEWWFGRCKFGDELTGLKDGLVAGSLDMWVLHEYLVLFTL